MGVSESSTTGLEGEALKVPVYLDYQATTPVDPRALDAMLPYFGDRFGNPHSVHHAYGWRAERAVEEARAQVAALIGARPQEIVFTSGATEANNLAIRGAAAFHRARKRHVITCQTEHKCVLEAVRSLAREDFDVTELPVSPAGLLDPADVGSAMRDDTALVSIMAVNNEIGVIQPITEIGALCAERGVLFHTDAAQAAGKIPLDVEAMRIDLLSISGHKLYGPMGVGALYVRRRPRARLEPLFHGGGQERGLRSGTLPMPLCVGFGEACRIAASEMATEHGRLAALRDAFLDRLSALLGPVRVNGDIVERFPGNLNVSFPGIDAEALMTEIPEIAMTTGSACSSASLEPSYVLRALGLSDEEAHGSLRIGFGRFTTDQEVAFAAERIAAAVKRLRNEAPAAATP